MIPAFTTSHYNLLLLIGAALIILSLAYALYQSRTCLHSMRQELATLTRERDGTAQKNTLLMEEMQHRIGNNLQLISAVLALQTRALADPVAKQALKDAVSRLHVIGTLQRHFYQGKDSRVPLDSYLRSAIDKIMATNAPPNIRCTVSGACDLVIHHDSAVPIALIVNEALLNAISHAFTDSTEGEIDVNILLNAETVEITIADNGKGLPADFDFNSTETMGLRISRALCQQLQAKLSLNPVQNGTSISLYLPIAPLIKSKRSQGVNV